MASEAIAIGQGGIRIVHKATGIAESTIQMKKGNFNVMRLQKQKNSQKGYWAKILRSKEDKMVEEITAIADINFIGEPESPLRWAKKVYVKFQLL